ncbi:hypothetical protein BD560DRAFT_440027 [Blakeslea trispora]|nr:hypothetical protein BD560DRAFT_440027 [Blakeslea trispora]
MEKTKALTLSGRPSSEWRFFLRSHGITRLHDRTSNQPLRYLGLPLISSIQQRRLVEEQLLTTIRNICAAYGPRQLSIWGRVIVVNVIVLSQLWYCLRMISLPLSFFKQVRSLVRAFVTKGIQPGFRYDVLCLRIHEVVLGLLDPVVQHHRLFVRWIREAFRLSLVSLVRPYILDHVSRFFTKGTSSTLSCFYPAIRAPCSLDYGHFMYQFFSTFDRFYKADSLSDDHWLLTKRPRLLLTADSFCIDRNGQSFRLLGATDCPPFPRLLARLNHGLQTGSLLLHSSLQEAVMNFQDSEAVFSTLPFVESLRSSLYWMEL